jgi:aspartyl-tRNA(Asn)/glutamyl-tRNA(Gln) amidotransferase subunit A
MSSDEDLCFLPVGDLAGHLRAGALSAEAVTEAHLRRIDAFDGQLHSYITVTADAAREAARSADARRLAGAVLGPLHGVPFGLKDMFETRGVRTTAHSRVLQHHIPDRDAEVVARLHGAGGVLLGKHASHEFAHGGPSFDLPWPPARNPWNPAHYTGSSSSGSAAAVAAGLAPFALGTDTGGSVRTPAWMCGVVGFKPTFGRVSRTGVIPFSSSCDHVGPLTRTVADAALVLQVIAGHDPRDPGSARAGGDDLRLPRRTDLRGLRLGVLRHHWEEDTRAKPELAKAVDDAIALLRDLGADVQDVRVRSLHEYYAVRILLTESELFARHQQHLRERAGDYGDHFLGRTLAAALFTSADYIAAQRERRRMIEEFGEIHSRFDALVTAGSGPAPRMDAHRSIGARQKWSSPSMGTVFSVTGAPALALPCGFSADGLPLGLQIAGRHFDDAAVLEIGHAYEKATDWHLRRPALVPGATAPPVDGSHQQPDGEIDAPTRAHVEAALHHAGLRLDDHQLALLFESAPHALDMARRVNRALPWEAEPAASFCADEFASTGDASPAS